MPPERRKLAQSGETGVPGVRQGVPGVRQCVPGVRQGVPGA